MSADRGTKHTRLMELRGEPQKLPEDVADHRELQADGSR